MDGGIEQNPAYGTARPLTYVGCESLADASMPCLGRVYLYGSFRTFVPRGFSDVGNLLASAAVGWMMGSWRAEPPGEADEPAQRGARLVARLGARVDGRALMAPSYLRWPPGCTPIELYDVSGEVTTIPDGEVCELDAWPS
jgi:hypothetical protein